MSGQWLKSNEAGGGPVQQPLRLPGAASGLEKSQPLGVILFCRKRQLDEAPSSEPASDPRRADASALANLERRTKSRIYRVYACENEAGGGWEYFTILEFADLRAWNEFEQELNRNGIGSRFDWDVRAFGRRLG